MVRDFAIKNDQSGAWMVPFGATVKAFLLSPVVAIATFLLVYYIIGIFAPRTRESAIES